MTEKERAKQLAEEHWEYVGPTVRIHMPDEDQLFTRAEVMAVCEHHFKTAAIHFYGHAIEDERNGMFRPSIGEPLTTEEIAEIVGPCNKCLDSFSCDGSFRKANGECLHHRPKGGK